MRGFSIAMTNAPRCMSTINTTIASMRGAGFAEMIYVFSEPDSPALGGNIKQFFNSRTFGCFRNFYHTLNWMIENTDSDYILMCQDDVIYNKDARKKLDQALKLKNIGYISLYLSNHDKRLAEGKTEGFYEHTIGFNPCFWGALSLCFSREAVTHMVEHPKYLDHYRNRNDRVDCIVSEVMKQMGASMYYPVPSLTTHIGYNSTIGHTPMQDHKGYKFRN